MRVVNCQRCGASVPILNLTAELEREISDTAIRVGRMQAILKLKEKTGVGLAEGKTVIHHLCDDGAKCHRCGRELLDDRKEINCPKCRSLNLRW
jgi:Zn finger protein HypA/HybF involved in hydrogenase expression